MLKHSLLIIILLGLSMGASHALIPPMTQEELLKDSTHILEAVVSKIQCNGPIVKTTCAITVPYKAHLTIKKYIKGQPLKEPVSLLFKGRTNTNDCVGGDVDAMHNEDEHGIYYLTCRGAECHVTHWNGVKKIINRGKFKMPKC